ncbi:MAG: phosphoribosylformylglycinamidine cyclo-ligase [Verrucomicrobiia bacterium]
MSHPRSNKAYTRAGVDVDLGNSLKSTIQKLAGQTHGPRVLGKIGGFGGFFRATFPGLKEPVLVASIDGVGTKLKLAFATGDHEAMARDLVNHCVNDIAVTGATPLFFLDYIGAEHLDPAVFAKLIRGFSKACQATGCALLGGETAQMPGLYASGEYDLAGCIIGVVDRSRILDGSKIRPGDVLLGLPSTGLHTNGYSLARRVLLEELKLPLSHRPPGWKTSIGTELLRPHRCYLNELQAIPIGKLHGAAHITGGGILDNLPRILPSTVDAEIETAAWRVPPLFELIGKAGDVPREEMFQVFNMGIGMVVIVPERNARELAKAIRARLIGRVTSGSGQVHLLK